MQKRKITTFLDFVFVLCAFKVEFKRIRFKPATKSTVGGSDLSIAISVEAKNFP